MCGCARPGFNYPKFPLVSQVLCVWMCVVCMYVCLLLEQLHIEESESIYVYVTYVCMYVCES
jgi:hypothetical protein